MLKDRLDGVMKEKKAIFIGNKVLISTVVKYPHCSLPNIQADNQAHTFRSSKSTLRYDLR